MKKYPFAKLYLSLLLVLAALSALLGVGVLAMGSIQTIHQSNEISKIKSTAKIYDTNKLVSQMQSALDAVTEISPNTSISLPHIGKVPVSDFASLTHEQIKLLSKLTSQCDQTVNALKSEYLAVFDENIGFLEDAARKRLAQLRQADAPTVSPSTRQLKSTLLYDHSGLNNDHLEQLKTVSSFLKDDVRYYSPSDAAHKAASSANLNLTAAYNIYKMDYDIALENINAVTIKPRIPTATQRPQTEVLLEFIDNLSAIKKTAHKLLINGWVVERTIEEIESRIDAYYAEIDILNGARYQALIQMSKSMLVFFAAAVLLLVIRDFLSTAIDTAQNTAAMRDALEGTDVKYD